MDTHIIPMLCQGNDNSWRLFEAECYLSTFYCQWKPQYRILSLTIPQVLKDLLSIVKSFLVIGKRQSVSKTLLQLLWRHSYRMYRSIYGICLSGIGITESIMSGLVCFSLHRTLKARHTMLGGTIWKAFTVLAIW